MILLDTCTLLWLAGDPGRLSEVATDRIQRLRDRLFVCSISAFEIGIKVRKGALELPGPVESWFPAALAHHGVRELVVDGAVAARSTSLPSLHADPCDRMIVAAAQIHAATILSPDPLIRAYPDTSVLW